MLLDVKQKSGARRAFPLPVRLLYLLCLLPVLALLPPSTPAATTPVRAAPSALPGGKTTFVVATAKLHNGTIYDNWTQLGWYRFDASTGQVRAETFVWRQNAPADQLRRERAGTLPDAECSGGAGQVTRCQVMTAPGYSAQSSPQPPVQRTGGYVLRSQNGTTYLDIRWPRGVTETWSVHPLSALVRLEWVSSNNSTAGYAYGSNAPISERRGMDTVRGHGTLPYTSTGWTRDTVKKEEHSGFQPSLYQRCPTTTWCLTHFQKTSTVCDCGQDRPATSIEYYITRVSSRDRRDTQWHWCSCLVRDHGTCYAGNSHIKPLLQIIDDDHRFRGYVGAEASFYPYETTDHTDPRRQDMLGVFRFAEVG